MPPVSSSSELDSKQMVSMRPEDFCCAARACFAALVEPGGRPRFLARVPSVRAVSFDLSLAALALDSCLGWRWSDLTNLSE
eukprot:1184257-Prorocentrum_minimum.AAC.7